MSETQEQTSDRSSSQGDGGQCGGDQANRSEREQLSSKPEPNSSQPEENMSREPKPEENMSRAPKPEANMSQGPKGEAKPEAKGDAKSTENKPEAKGDAKPAENKPEAKGDAKHTDGKTDGKQQGQRPENLTKEQIQNIAKDAKSLDDLKLKLGLGPVTDKALGDYLASKGFKPGDGQQQPQGPKYTGPSVGPTPPGQEVSREKITVWENGRPHQVEVSGTKEQIQAAKDANDRNTLIQTLKGISSVGAGVAGGMGSGKDPSNNPPPSSSPGGGQRW